MSQRYHLYRAVFIAKQRGLRVQGFVAAPPPWRKRWRAEVRELAARVLAVLDLYLLDTQPHFLGPPEPIDIDAGKAPP